MIRILSFYYSYVLFIEKQQILRAILTFFLMEPERRLWEIVLKKQSIWSSISNSSLYHHFFKIVVQGKS